MDPKKRFLVEPLGGDFSVLLGHRPCRFFRPGVHLAFVAVGLLIALAPAHASEAPPAPVAARGDAPPAGLPRLLPFDPGVKDPLFAVLIGLVASRHYGTLTGEHLERELVRHGGRSRLPYWKLRQLDRPPPLPGRAGVVTLTLDTPLDLPIPYSILGYHPGSAWMSGAWVFHEWSLGTVRVPSAGTTADLEEVHAFGLERGRLRVDIDGWLDLLMGSALDDTEVTGLLLFRRAGGWFGLAVGYNDRRLGRSGALDFAADRILFPSPSEMRAVARQMRPLLEALLANERPSGGSVGQQ